PSDATPFCIPTSRDPAPYGGRRRCERCGMDGSEAGTSAVVVGGSRGLGRAVAAALHGAGADVVTLSRGSDTEPAPWTQLAVDASDPAEVERFFTDDYLVSDTKNVLISFAGTRYNVPLIDSDVDQ